MKKTTVAQPSEIQAELLELSGSTANYNQLMDNLQEQMSQAAQKRGKINLHLDIFAATPAKRVTARKAALGRSGSLTLQPLNGTKRPARSQRKKK